MGKFGNRKQEGAVKAGSSGDAKPSVKEVVADTEGGKDKPIKEKKPPKPKSRNFSNDMSEYLRVWKHEKASWKYNKVLQSWALTECLNAEVLGKNLFHDLVPYLASVMGGARDRLLERCDAVLAAHDDMTEAPQDVKRAKKIVARLRAEDKPAKEDT